jgi:hypothetical protein
MLPTVSPSGSCSANAGRSRPIAPVPSPRTPRWIAGAQAPKIFRSSGSGASALDAGGHQHHPARLGQARRHLGHDAAGGEACAGRETELAVDRGGERQDRPLDRCIAVVARLTVEPLAAREVDEHLVDARHHHRRCVATGDVAHPVGVAAVGVAPGRQVDRVGRQAPRLDQRQPRLDPQPADLVAGGRHHAAGAGPAADDHGFPFQRRIEHALDRYEEGVEVEAADPRLRERARSCRLRRRRHEPGRD